MRLSSNQYGDEVNANRCWQPCPTYFPTNSRGPQSRYDSDCDMSRARTIIANIAILKQVCFHPPLEAIICLSSKHTVRAAYMGPYSVVPRNISTLTAPWVTMPANKSKRASMSLQQSGPSPHSLQRTSSRAAPSCIVVDSKPMRVHIARHYGDRRIAAS
jgi:hypothetical protein